MAQIINLKKSSFESGFVSSKFGKLYSKKDFENLINYNFEEILKYMEEHDFKESIDSSFLNLEGFYLIENIINKHLSRVYSEIYSISNLYNKKLLDVYYFKYQIHNFLALIRLFNSKEDLSVYLIGDERKKEKFMKAYNMPKFEDAILYITKKLKLDYEEIINIYNKGIFYLENYLYKKYYERLFKIKFKYNGLDEKYFYEFIKKLVGAINLRVFLRLKLEDDENLFKDFFISYGDFSREFFENLSNMNNKELFNHIKKTTGVEISCLDDKCFYIVDKYYNQVKKNFNQYLSKVGFSSPFYILKFLFAFEENMGKIRTLLKSKLLGVNNEEIKKMLSLED